jgi:uncharacterized protein YdaT
VVRCLKGELSAPGLVPLNAEEIHFWFQNITLEDIEAVNQEIDVETPSQQDHPSRVHSMLQKIRERMRGAEATATDRSSKTDSEEGRKQSDVDSPDKPGE